MIVSVSVPQCLAGSSAEVAGLLNLLARPQGHGIAFDKSQALAVRAGNQIRLVAAHRAA